jgi:prophage regulatory protein
MRPKPDGYYEAALIPIAVPAAPKPPPPRRAEPIAPPPATTASHSPALRYIRLREVSKRLGVGHSTIYRMIAAGEFPRQLKLSEHTAVWVEREVDAFMNARIAERDQEVHTPEVTPYLRIGEVMRLTGMTHAMIYDGVRAKTFPKWADLPKRGSGWMRTDIEAWLAEHGERSGKA